MPCPRCGASGVDLQGFCVRCRFFRGLPAPAYVTRRSPLLIPGLIFGVVAVLLITAVLVYALTAGDEDPAPAGAAPSRTTSPAAPPSATTGAADLPAPSTTGSPSASGGSPLPSRSVSPVASCLVGVWIEERHDERFTVPNEGTFAFKSTGTYQRYSDSGRVVFSFGGGVTLSGTNGATTYAYLFSGFISYTFQIDNGMLIFADPQPNGTETYYRNGKQESTGPLYPRVPAPLRVNCGSIAMSQASNTTSIDLKRA